uniref:Uncharacterized protein n=1 Tax=Magallana gigas TaxID=29159 RepID=A0A8W8J8I2_MAGGI
MSSGIEACLNVSRFFFEVFRKTHAVPLQKHAKGDNVMELLNENNDVIMTSNNLGLLFRFSSLQIVCNAEDSNINPHNLKIIDEHETGAIIRGFDQENSFTIHKLWRSD